MKSPAVPAKRFALGCGCKDAKSVSVSASATTGTSTTTTTVARGRSAGGANPWASTTTGTLTSASLWEDAVADLGYKDGSCRMLPESAAGRALLRAAAGRVLRALAPAGLPARRGWPPRAPSPPAGLLAAPWPPPAGLPALASHASSL